MRAQAETTESFDKWLAGLLDPLSGEVAFNTTQPTWPTFESFFSIASQLLLYRPVMMEYIPALCLSMKSQGIDYFELRAPSSVSDHLYDDVQGNARTLSARGFKPSKIVCGNSVKMP